MNKRQLKTLIIAFAVVTAFIMGVAWVVGWHAGWHSSSIFGVCLFLVVAMLLNFGIAVVGIPRSMWLQDEIDYHRRRRGKDELE